MRLLLFTYLIVLATASGAADSDSFAAFSGKLDVRQRIVRTKAAQEVLGQVERLANLVQSPRPNEVSWVAAEQVAIAAIKSREDSLARSVQLFRSPEFQQVKVHAHLQEARDALKCIVEPSVRLKREVFCWATASFLLDEGVVFNDGLDILLRAKRLPEDTARRVGAGTNDGVQLWFRLIARGTQEYIVLPYLRGELQ